MISFLLRVPARVWVLLAFIIAFCVLLISHCDARRDAARLGDQAIIDKARQKSAEENLDAYADNAFVNQETREEARRAQDLIRQTDPADRDRVARRELCKLQGGASC